MADMMGDMPKGGKLVAGLMRDGPDFKMGWSFANALTAVAEQEVEKSHKDVVIDIAMLARDAVLAVLSQHACYMSDANENEIDDIIVKGIGDFTSSLEFDPADCALRTCLCGKRIEGFDEYTIHLQQVFDER